MKLREYSGVNSVTLDNFLSMGEDKILKFDFLTQGEEPDRAELTNSIYHCIFPWFNEQTMAGDTLNTYRIAVKKYYGKYYRFLNRKKQLEVLEIIKKYTNHDNNQIFEFEEIDKNGNKYFQLCNNYHLGNFGILPIHGGINPKRATGQYQDFFNLFLQAVKEFYSINPAQDDRVVKAIYCQKSYFKQFEDMSDFIEKNHLMSFTKSKNSLKFIDLSESLSFEEYVAESAKIIEKRGKELFISLHDL